MTLKKKICGLVMPISECEGYPSSHWGDVKAILEMASVDADLDPRLVSDTLESNLIHKEILQNIYNDDIVICDVSSRNPNVFFELGIRMATQLPTVIVKDDKTPYPFDTGPNRYIEYPSDLRHPAMEKFKSEVTNALKKTIDHSKENSFIGQLGPFQIPDVESASIPASEIILSKIEGLERTVSRMNSMPSLSLATARKIAPSTVEVLGPTSDGAVFEVSGYSDTQIINGLSDLKKHLPKSQSLEWEIDSIERLRHTVRLRGKNLTTKSFQIALQSSIENAMPF